MPRWRRCHRRRCLADRDDEGATGNRFADDAGRNAAFGRYGINRRIEQGTKQLALRRHRVGHARHQAHAGIGRIISVSP